MRGPFCSQCGQRDVPPYPSVRELVVDAFWELSGWDGRFASTVRALIRRPGLLTREFLEGRRARYISPLRLYLMCSLVYFLISAAAPELSTKDGKGLFIGVRTTPTGAQTVSRPEQVANATSEALRNQVAISAAERDSVLASIAKAPAVFRPFLQRAVTDPSGFKKGMLENMPRMLFALLPIFALIVAVFYRGRKYPEHLYFAIHLHAFVFMALSVAALSKFPHVSAVAMVAGIAMFVWIPIYATLAFRRAYGGSLVRTLVKESAIGAIYAVVTFAAFILTVAWVARFG
jgi:uncharacterized protein DUF3667